MNVHLKLKQAASLIPTDILFQTTYWSQVKSRLGWAPKAFDFESSNGRQGDVLVLIRPIGQRLAGAYVPQGPEVGLDPEEYGPFLETLSESMIKHLDSTVSFIRYDLPWKSIYEDDTMDSEIWSGRPAQRLQELRMNIGTQNWNLRKAAFDMTVADALIVDLGRPEEEILSAMRPKTRYNIRLAQRKEVRVFNASFEMLPLFYDLYLQTAKRNGFYPASYRHFSQLFSPLVLNPESAEILFLLAARDSDLLAGAIVAISEHRAIYLFGASSNALRNLMGSYAVHWEAIKLARRKGCLEYDMGSISPVADPGHPYFGMYRFKTGFGGNIVHRNGTWDYPLNRRVYSAFRSYEASNVRPSN